MIKEDAMQHDEQQLGRYHLLKQIGRGGMGEVWLAEDPRLQRQVAIKMLPPQEQYSQKDADLFEREAQVVASLNHPHVLPVHDYGEQQFPDGQVINYLVMPYISGGSLSDLIKQRTASGEGFHYREVLALLMQAAEAIDYAHTKGMVHRDIKPANMLLRSEGSLLLADFGIALMVAHSDDFQEAGVIVGTPLYIAPEQAQGRPAAASDLYSLAVIAYQFVAGRPPFQAETSYATIVQHIVQAPPPPRQWNPDLPAECGEVLLRGLAKKPEERYSTAREFVAALTQSLGAEDMLPVAPSPSSSAQNETRRFMTRRNLIIGAAASVVVLGGAAGGIWAMSRNKTSQPVAKKKLSGPARSVMVLRDLQSSPKALLWTPGKNILTTTCFDEGAIKLWDIDALRLQNLLEYKSTFTQKMTGIADAAWSQDGRYLAVTTNPLNGEANTIYIHILSADLSRQLAGFEQGIRIPSILVRGMGWLGSRYLVATWDDDNNLNSTNLGMWDITRPQLRPQPLLIKGTASTFDAALNDNVEMNGQTDLSLAIAPDATRLALAYPDRVLLGKPEIVGDRVVWKQDQPVRTPGDPDAGIDGILWAGDGKHLLGVVENRNVNYMQTWDLASQPSAPFKFSIPQHATKFASLAVYPKADKLMFAAGSLDGKIYLWDGQTRKLPVRTLISPSIQKQVLRLAWSSDGQWLAASYADIDATILIWKI